MRFLGEDFAVFAKVRFLMSSHLKALNRLKEVQKVIASCRSCDQMVGPPVHGAAILSPILLLGQAPGPHEAALGRPFAYTAGKTLFRWFQESLGISEAEFRERVYMAAVARCFPGKASGGGDRVPHSAEILNCSQHLKRELQILKPHLILAVGKLAISQVLGPEVYGSTALLTDVVGTQLQAKFYGQVVDVVCLPHPSGLSAWPKVEPGKTLLQRALKLIGEHPAWHAGLSG